MSTSEERWFEVWYSQGEDVLPTWLLIVTADPSNPGLVLVYDPLEGYRIVHQGDNYQNTCLWLGEDEYELVDGRVFPDDDWPLATRKID